MRSSRASAQRAPKAQSRTRRSTTNSTRSGAGKQTSSSSSAATRDRRTRRSSGPRQTQTKEILEAAARQRERLERERAQIEARVLPIPRLAQLEPHRWILLRAYRAPGAAGLGRVIVPAGLEIDGASIPRAAWSYHHPFGSPLRAAIVHDWRYHSHNIDREAADLEFYENLLSTGHSELDAYLMWQAVRLGGWRPWNRGAELLEAGARLVDPRALRQHLRVALAGA